MENEITKSHYIGMVRYILSRTKIHLPWDEIESIAGLTYWKCRLAYDPNKAAWSTYLFKSMRSELIRAAIRERKNGISGACYWEAGKKSEKADKIFMASISAWSSDKSKLLGYEERTLDKIWLRQMIRKLKSMLPKPLFEAWYLYHVAEMSQGQAAKLVGISRVAFNCRVKKAQERINKARPMLKGLAHAKPN